MMPPSATDSIPHGQTIPAGQAVPAMRPASALEGAELHAAIGRLVREALEHQLGTSPLPTPPASSHQPAPPAGHRIGDAVVSLGVLERLPQGASRVEIGTRAVLTPAAADLLRQRGVEVVRSEPAGDRPPTHAAATSAPAGWIADADHPERTAGYVRQLASRGLTVSGVELPLGAGESFSNSVGVMIAELPAVHVDHWARRRSVSAAAVGSLSEVARIARAMTPAVWVLDAERLSFSGRVAVAAECFRLAGTQTAERRRPR